jgi:hypothetical protein
MIDPFIDVYSDAPLRHFVEFPSALRRFTSFLKSEFSQENIDFYLAVNEVMHHALLRFVVLNY